MQPNRTAVISVALLGVTLPSCRGPTNATNEPIAAAAEPAPGQGARAAARSVDLLRAWVAADRQAVELGEQRLVRQRSLFGVGRLTDVELQQAELDVLRLRQTLARREQELAAAADLATRGS
jgi:hypothetical protein